MIVTKLVQRASKVKRVNGIYLVKENGILLGSIEKPYHYNGYRVFSSSKWLKSPVTFSTKKSAELFIIKNKS